MDAASIKSTIYRRKGSRNWQVQFRDDEGHSIQKGTGTSNRLEAYRIAADWQTNGIPQGRTKASRLIAEIFAVESVMDSIKHAPLSPEDAIRIVDALQGRGLINVKSVADTCEDTLLVNFLENFWDFNESPYVKEKLAHGQSISRRHCYDSSNRIKYWAKAYPKLRLSEFSIKEAHAFPLTLRAEGLSPSTINKIVLVCSTAIAWAKRTGMIDHDPFEGTMRFSETHEKRGILTDDEVHKLFKEGVWPDTRTRVASLLACTTALRAGECRAVQAQDLIPGSKREGGAKDPSEKGFRPDQLFVWSWCDIEKKRKQPKNGEHRIVPLLPEVYDELSALIDLNPFGKKPESYVFYSAEKDKPIRPEPLLTDLEKALASIGIDKDERLSRNINFHSWRHYYSTKMSTLVASNKIRLVTGHKSASVFQGYSDHVNESDIRDVSSAEVSAFASMFTKNERVSKERVC